VTGDRRRDPVKALLAAQARTRRVAAGMLVAWAMQVSARARCGPARAAEGVSRLPQTVANRPSQSRGACRLRLRRQIRWAWLRAARAEPRPHAPLTSSRRPESRTPRGRRGAPVCLVPSFVFSRGQQKYGICSYLRDTTRHEWTIRSALQAGGRRFDPGWLHQRKPLEPRFECWRRRSVGLLSHPALAHSGRVASWPSPASCASIARLTLPWIWSLAIRSRSPSASSTLTTAGFTRARRSVTPEVSATW
jgi:hypothetical protein